MKLIIDIPEETYNDIQSRDWKNGELIFSEEWKAIHNGTPTVTQKSGKWIERESGTEDMEYGFETVIVCSHCGFPATTFYSEDCESRTQIRTDFCPNCGAKMESENRQNEV